MAHRTRKLVGLALACFGVLVAATSEPFGGKASLKMQIETAAELGLREWAARGSDSPG